MTAHARCREPGRWWAGAFPDGLDALAALYEHRAAEHPEPSVTSHVEAS